MLFKDVVGQQALKMRLISTVKEGRISHAQLFLGEEGGGNLPLALAYAQYVSCLNRGDQDSCGVCSSCVKYQKLAHPDLHFVFPVATNKTVTKNPVSNLFLTDWREAIQKIPYLNLFQWLSFIGVDNKQGNISTEESSDILRALNLKAFESAYKIIVIWMPERFNIPAANKLLKILEEPRPGTLFLLVASKEEDILLTIRSRTQLVKVGKLSDEEMLEILTQKHQLSNANATGIIRMAEGNYSKALEVLTYQEGEDENFKQFSNWMRLCFGAKVGELVKWVEEISAIGRERQKSFLVYSLHLLRESLMMNYGDEKLVKLNQEEQEFCLKFAPFIHASNCMDLIKEMNESVYYIERNAAPRILFLDLSLKTTKLLRIKNVNL